MTDVWERTRELLEDRPEIEDAIRELLTVDTRGRWTFDDISIDSGSFGEIVSRGIVEEDGDGYRVVDRRAVQSALDGEEYEPAESRSRSDSLRDALSVLDRRAIGLVLGAVLLALTIRVAFTYGAVFRGESIVLFRNDPYYYRYQIEQLLRSRPAAFSLSSLSRLPEQLGANNELLFVVAMWWAAAAVGGTSQATGHVLAWYPVVAGLFAAVVVYLTAVRLGKDRRVGLAAVLVMAVVPINAQRTGLGFADHHPFDLVWFVVALYSLTVLADRAYPPRDDLFDFETSYPTWLASVALGVGVGGQLLAWRGAALFVVPVGLYAFLAVIADLRRDVSPLRSQLPLLVGLGVGSVVTLVPHLLFGWYPAVRAFVPAVLLGGSLLVVAVGELSHRMGLSVRTVAAGELGASIVAVAVGWLTVPQSSEIVAQFGGLVQRSGSTITETIPLVSPQTAIWWGIIIHFGFLAFATLPYLGWGFWVVYRDDQPLTPLPVALYAVVCTLLSLLQFRFVFFLSVPISIFGGFALVHVASEANLLSPPNVFLRKTVSRWRQSGSWDVREITLPSARTTALLALLFVASLNLAFVTNATGWGSMTISEEDYSTAQAIDRYAGAHGAEYPDSYTLSEWGLNRMYNYFVSGESQSYVYARDTYKEFLASTDPGPWYAEFDRRPVGFVVTSEVTTEVDSRTMWSRLHENFGSRSGGTPGLAHYRAIYATPDGSHKAFAVVPGAKIDGTGPANATVTVRTNVSLEHASFTYERQVTTDENGDFSVVVPYPGRYTAAGQTYDVTEAMVRSD